MVRMEQSSKTTVLKEKTREFFEMLEKRRKEAEEHPERMIPLEEIK